MNRQERRAAAKQGKPLPAAGSGLDVAQLFADGLSHHQAGRLPDAEENYRQVLRLRPDHADALHLLGVLAFQLGHYDVAVEHVGRAVKQNPNNAAYLSNLALAEQQLGRFDDALRNLDKALDANPNHVEAVNNRGNVLLKLGRFADALISYDRLVVLKPDLPEAFNNRGIALKELGQPADALTAFDRAIALRPSYTEALHNRGNALRDLGRPAEAIESFDRALALNANHADVWHNRGCALEALGNRDEALACYQRARQLNPSLTDAHLNSGAILQGLGRLEEALTAFVQATALRADLAAAWLGRGNLLCQLERYDEALDAYDRGAALDATLAPIWLGRGNALLELKKLADALAAYDQALTLDSNVAGAWLGRGNVCSELGQLGEALVAYDQALACDPQIAQAQLGRGNVLGPLGRAAEAMAAYDAALTLRSDMAEAWLGRANMLSGARRLAEALTAYDRALQLKPRLPGLAGARLKAKLQVCDWSNFACDRADLLAGVAQGQIVQPFDLLNLSDAAADQLRCATLFSARNWPEAGRAPAKPRPAHGRIRIAYMSADFRQHPMARLMADIFERHDRIRFEVTAISLGADDGSPMRTRLEAAFDRFIDARALTDDAIVELIEKDGIHILVDLMGYTRDARTGVVARKPAPVQVNYLGFAGTMGLRAIDYIIADPAVIPQASRAAYAENIAWLPYSYYPNGRPAGERGIMTRAQAGLPEEGFVFCCFNNSFKILPDIFEAWMRILAAVGGSVLWLLEDNEFAAANLRKEARARGIDPMRLVFARRAPAAEHLARHGCADLFLDTLPYNAHTTALDALDEGVPVLTRPGEAFASRVAASLLTALDLPELITTSLEAYEGVAIDLARDAPRLAAVRRKLDAHRATSPLFDIARYTRHLEAAFAMMHARAQAGEAPQDFALPA